MSVSSYTHGLLGVRLGHSFSARFFEETFAQHPHLGFSYGLFELEDINELPELLRAHPLLQGLNVTFPFKESVCAYVDELHPLAARIGAVNVLKKQRDGRWVGYNTDYAGFGRTLFELPVSVWSSSSALICGTGGAAKAVGTLLKDVGMRVCVLSRARSRADMTYEAICAAPTQSQDFALWVQATPLGTYPNEELPQLPYTYAQPGQFFYDLAYNPEQTPFLREGIKQGCHTKNGLEMLYAQAKESWLIWEPK